MFGFYRSRQLDGTIGNGPRYGTYVLSSSRVHAGWGAVSDRFWQTPRGAAIWPPEEPVGLDRVARFNRILSHFRVRSLNDAKIVMASTPGFICAVPITKAWRSAPGGVIPMPRDTGNFIEHHAIHAFGYQDDFQQIRFWNSWVRGGDRTRLVIFRTSTSRHISLMRGSITQSSRDAGGQNKQINPALKG
jgi:hypothetical protein